MNDNLDIARECAIEVLLSRLPALIGKDFKNKIPTLKSRIAAIRAGLGDELPEVQSALLALSRRLEDV